MSGSFASILLEGRTSREYSTTVLGICSLAVYLALVSCSPSKPTPAPPPPSGNTDEDTQDWTGVSENFVLNSTPAGANVKFSSGEKCKTPCTVKRAITENFDVTLEKNGFRPKTLAIVSHTNVLPGSGASGKPKLSKPKLSPNPASVTLEPVWDR